MSHWEYYIVLLLVFVPTFIFSFHPKSPFRSKFDIVCLSLVCVATPFIIWDMLATARGHWSFNPDFVSGLAIVNLPLEEVLFFLAIPWSCSFLWLTIKNFHTLDTFLHDLLTFKK